MSRITTRGENVRGLMLALAGLALALPAWAQKLDNLQSLSQEEFRLMSEDLASAFSYRPMAAAAPLGFPGFDLGVGLTGVKLKNPELIDRASSDEVDDTLVIPTLRARVGLPLGFDVGATYSQVPSSDITFYGGEIKWAFVPGDTIWPALGVRANATRVSGVTQWNLDTRGLDVSISKGFWFATPYAGLGRVYAKSDPKGTAGLKEESFSANKAFVGLSLKFLVVDFNLEADKTGDVSAYSFKLSLRF